MKKSENKYMQYNGPTKELSPFEALKSSLKNNLKRLKKEDESEKDQLA